MKKFMILTFFVLLSVSLYGADAAFRGIEWGAKLSDLKDSFTLVTDDGDRKTYTRKGDSLSLYDVKLDSVIYVFDKGAFCEATMTAKGESNWNKIRDGLVVEHGRSDSYRIYTIYNRSGGTTIIDAAYDKDTDLAKVKFTAPGYFYGK